MLERWVEQTWLAKQRDGIQVKLAWASLISRYNCLLRTFSLSFILCIPDIMRLPRDTDEGIVVGVSTFERSFPRY